MLSDKIRMLRESQGLNQTEFAKRLFVTPGAVNQWERGKTSPDTSRLIAMAKEFSVPLDYFSDDPDGKEYTEAELIKQHVLIELGAQQPKTEEAKILSRDIDQLPKAQREQALAVFRAMFSPKYEHLFTKETDDET